MCLPAGIPGIKRTRMAAGGKENLEVCFLIFGGDFNYPVISVNYIQVSPPKRVKMSLLKKIKNFGYVLLIRSYDFNFPAKHV